MSQFYQMIAIATRVEKNLINTNIMDDQLNDLIKELLSKQDRIIPIIGDGCFYYETGKEDGHLARISLQEYIVSQLAGDDFSFDRLERMSKKGYYGMSILCDEYCRRHFDVNRSGFRRKVKSVVNAGMEEGRIHLDEEVKSFLEAGKFYVIITTNVFHLLKKELSPDGLLYHEQSFVTQAPKEGSRAEEIIDSPTIYQIFGQCGGEFVLTEDDLLKFLHYLNFPGYENGQGATSLVKYIKDKTKSNDGLGNCILMPIGCESLPNWLFKFLWYPLSPDVLFGRNVDFIGGIFHEYEEDNEFRRFLYEYNFRTYPIEASSNSDPLLRNLTLRIREQVQGIGDTAESELAVRWQEDNHWDIFLSYASEDEKYVSHIYDVLTTKFNKKVWKDNRNIKLGDRYWSAIQFGIEHSDRCMFIISNAYLKKATIRSFINVYGEEEECGVYKEIQRIELFFLQNGWDIKAINSYSIPIIKPGTFVTLKDAASGNPIETPLTGNLLETLYRREGYTMLRTDALFERTQAVVLDESNFFNVLKQI
jgi:hypothetical protein